MKNAALPLLAIALVLAAVAWFVFDQTDDGLDTDLGDTATTTEDKTPAEAVDASASKGANDGGNAPTRETLSSKDDEEVDLLYAQAMAGFRGRLVFTSGNPAPDKSIRFFRIDPELIQNPYLFSKESVMKPELEMYETKSAADGTFTVGGVWPQAFYLLVADVKGEHQRTTLVEKTPGAGEVVDLGDILLPDLGTISGRVVDMDGEPAADALVRALDLPGTILDMAPIERFDPDGGMIIDEGGFKIVMTMPPWVRTAFDILPIPTTRTDPAGEFILRGVQPGQNAVLVNFPEHVGLVKKGVRVRPGKEKKVGKLSLREGEIAQGKVMDMDDEPVVGAEVLLANRHPVIPAHFGTFAKKTDEKGEFSLSGFAPGPVYAAVRRSPEEAWTVHGPVSVGGDLIIKLQKRVSLVLRIKTEGGAEVEDVQFKVAGTPGENGPGLDLASLGFVPWIDMKKRVEKQDDGRYRLFDLMPGDYSMAVQAKGHAPGGINVSLFSDLEKEIVLQRAIALEVITVDGDQRPIRNVKIYSNVRGASSQARVQNMPVLSGKTSRAGRVIIKNCSRGTVRLTASHPAFGSYHKEATLPTAGPLVITMLEAGVITGLLLDGGKPAKPGKWTINVQKVRREARGAMPGPPRLVVADLEGKFRMNGLAPGMYRVHCIPSMALVGSPGGMAAAMNLSSPGNDRQEVQVMSGGEAFVRLDPTGKRDVTGPSAVVSGTVMFNGRPATGMLIIGWTQTGRVATEVDGSGRFDIGRVGVGHMTLRLRQAQGNQIDISMIDGQLWSHNCQIKENEDQQFDLTLNTGSVSGVVTKEDGSPAATVEIGASGTIAAMLDKPKARSYASGTTFTDKNGRFDFKQLVAGDYRIRVRGNAGSVRSGKIVVQAGLPVTVNLKLAKVYTVHGTVDLSVYPDKTDYLHIRFIGTEDSSGTRVNNETGEFRLGGLPKGSYRVRINCWGSSNQSHREGSSAQPVVVDRDVKELKITPVFVSPKKKR